MRRVLDRATFEALHATLPRLAIVYGSILSTTILLSLVPQPVSAWVSSAVGLTLFAFWILLGSRWADHDLQERARHDDRAQESEGDARDRATDKT